jgi:hypothetical protein
MVKWMGGVNFSVLLTAVADTQHVEGWGLVSLAAVNRKKEILLGWLSNLRRGLASTLYFTLSPLKLRERQLSPG